MQRSVSLAPYTAARIGGTADWLLNGGLGRSTYRCSHCFWQFDIPFIILGGGSNVLVSDLGVRQPVILNKARNIVYGQGANPYIVTAESGANFGLLARQCARRGLSGLEWAAGIPGTVGGAVFGNAGAHGGDMAGSLQMAKILHRTIHGIVSEAWSLEAFQFDYRSSRLKRNPGSAVILEAQFILQPGDPRRSPGPVRKIQRLSPHNPAARSQHGIDV